MSPTQPMSQMVEKSPFKVGDMVRLSEQYKDYYHKVFHGTLLIAEIYEHQYNPCTTRTPITRLYTDVLCEDNCIRTVSDPFHLEPFAGVLNERPY